MSHFCKHAVQKYTTCACVPFDTADLPRSHAAMHSVRIIKDSEQSASAREDVDGEAYGGHERGTASNDKEEDDMGGTHPSRGDAQRGDRGRPHRQGGLAITDRTIGSKSPKDVAEWEWDEGGEAPTSPPRPHGRRTRALAVGNGHARPTPSYALPTKHFKALGRYLVFLSCKQGEFGFARRALADLYRCVCLYGRSPPSW